MTKKFKATRGTQKIVFEGHGARTLGYIQSLELCGWKVEVV